MPYKALFFAHLAQLCTFIGTRRKGLQESPSISRVGVLHQWRAAWCRRDLPLLSAP